MLTPDELYGLVAVATDPHGRSSFYRDLYGVKSSDSAHLIRSMEEWRALPFVTKKTLGSVPLNERSFIPLSEVDYLGASSGTSGRQAFFSPRSDVRDVDYRLRFHDFKKPMLSYLVPIMPHLHELFAREHGVSPRTITFDPEHSQASTRLARIAGANSISVFVHHIHAIGEAMKSEGINTIIRFIEITGADCSRAQYEYIKETFPNAVLLASYGAMEVDDAPSVGMPCKPIDGSEPLAVYHPKDSHFLEIFDPETETYVEPRAGAEGELVITAYRGKGAAFPLLRFRIGDRIQVVEDTCAHGVWSFTVLGRSDMDFVKVPGGILRADEIARVLRLFPERVTDFFQLHCYQNDTPEGPKMEPRLHVETRGTVDMEILAQDISAHLLTGPAYTYAEGVRDGRYFPLQCLLLGKNIPQGKHKRIIQH